MFRVVAIVAVLVSLPASGQDFTQVFAEKGSRGFVASERDSGARAPGRGEADAAGLRVELAELTQEAADLRAELESLRKEYQQLSHAYGDLVKARSRVRGIKVLTADSCGVCRAWHGADDKRTPIVRKDWIDADKPMPADMDPAEWTQVKQLASEKGLPLVWWRDKSGQLRTLAGRFTDRQIAWSMEEADNEVDARVPAAPVARPRVPGAIARLGARPW